MGVNGHSKPLFGEGFLHILHKGVRGVDLDLGGLGFLYCRVIVLKISWFAAGVSSMGLGV